MSSLLLLEERSLIGDRRVGLANPVAYLAQQSTAIRCSLGLIDDFFYCHHISEYDFTPYRLNP